MFGANATATPQGSLLQLRALDWNVDGQFVIYITSQSTHTGISGSLGLGLGGLCFYIMLLINSPVMLEIMLIIEIMLVFLL